jgi:hypothetical protein
VAVAAPGDGDDGGGWSVPGTVKERLERTPARRDQQWLFSLLPAFPLVLLVLRLWYLSRQDLQTMLLLVQYVSPLGLLSALLFTLVWVLPLGILLIRALGALLWVSAPTRIDALRSRLVRLSVRMPDWVVIVAILTAAVSWQLRFLPALMMLSLAILGLAVRDRFPQRRRLVRGVCVVLPLVAAAAAYAWLLPAGIEAVRSGETLTAVLLLFPPAATVFLTGPVPARPARLVTHWAAMAMALLAPFVVGVVFLRAPILPLVALEVRAGEVSVGEREPLTVVLAHVITVDDRMTTLLDSGGRVQFVPNGRIVSQTLCPGSEDVPASQIEVRGWPVEQTALEWLAPPPPSTPPDPRCQGRPL